MAELNRDDLAAREQEILKKMLELPRHPRGFQGNVQPVAVVAVGIFVDDNGGYWAADPLEQEPGEGETPEADLFLRSYIIIGKRRGKSLVDILLDAAPILHPQSKGVVGLLRRLLGR
jgi:hypothetical protein